MASTRELPSNPQLVINGEHPPVQLKANPDGSCTVDGQLLPAEEGLSPQALGLREVARLAVERGIPHLRAVALSPGDAQPTRLLVSADGNVSLDDDWAAGAVPAQPEAVRPAPSRKNAPDTEAARPMKGTPIIPPAAEVDVELSLLGEATTQTTTETTGVPGSAAASHGALSELPRYGTPPPAAHPVKSALTSATPAPAVALATEPNTSTPWSPAAAPAATPLTPGESSTSELLHLASKRQAAGNGLRHRLRQQLTPGHPSGQHESDELRRSRQLAAQLRGTRTILVANPKGSARKTTTAMMGAATLGTYYGGGVLAWDNNETRGTMGWRAGRPEEHGSILSLLGELDDIERLGDLDGHVVPQPGAHFDVLAGAEMLYEEDGDASEDLPLANFVESGKRGITATEVFRLHDVLSRFYRTLVMDTGNNIGAENWRAAAALSQLLVIPMTVAEDTSASAAWMIDNLMRTRYRHLVANAVTVVHAASPRDDKFAREHVVEHFKKRTRKVIYVPWEAALVGGTAIDYSAISQSGQAAWQEFGAAVIEGLVAAQ